MSGECFDCGHAICCCDERQAANAGATPIEPGKAESAQRLSSSSSVPSLLVRLETLEAEMRTEIKHAIIIGTRLTLTRKVEAWADELSALLRTTDEHHSNAQAKENKDVVTRSAETTVHPSDVHAASDLKGE